ncbi:hypothetical protein Droror1_Dr00007635 [Drosera rotundifolia]
MPRLSPQSCNSSSRSTPIGYQQGHPNSTIQTSSKLTRCPTTLRDSTPTTHLGGRLTSKTQPQLLHTQASSSTRAHGNPKPQFGLQTTNNHTRFTTSHNPATTIKPTPIRIAVPRTIATPNRNQAQLQSSTSNPSETKSQLHQHSPNEICQEPTRFPYKINTALRIPHCTPNLSFPQVTLEANRKKTQHGFSPKSKQQGRTIAKSVIKRELKEIGD